MTAIYNGGRLLTYVNRNHPKSASLSDQDLRERLFDLKITFCGHRIHVQL